MQRPLKTASKLAESGYLFTQIQVKLIKIPSRLNVANVAALAFHSLQTGHSMTCGYG